MIPLIYNLRSLFVRKTTTAASVFGIALVVFVMSASMMLTEGVRRTMGSSGRPDEAIVIRKGSDAELSSNVEIATVSLVTGAPQVKKASDGRPMGVGEVVVVAAMDKIGFDGVSNVTLRGVPDNVMAFRPDVKILEGRAARPGSDEVIVGRAIRGRFKGLEIGSTVELRKNRPVTVVGIFDAGGSSFESEVWVDVDGLRAAFGRDGIVSSVRVKLASAADFDGFQAYIEQDKRLGLEALRESKYYENQSAGTALFVGVMGNLIAFFFSLGAMIGAMITMYASVSNRQREIGTLRALGFSRINILISFVFEALMISAIGGALGCAASLAMGLVHFSMMNFASWSEIVFSFTPTPGILGTAMAFAGVMGLFGGLLPAVQAARVSAVQAMRD
jgi:putative ABC transport system permease protein